MESQKFEGIFDSNDCWDFSGIDWLEMGLDALWPNMPQTHKDFCISNNLCDTTGNFSLSRRYIAVLSGVTNNGNYQLDFWTGTDYSADVVGVIPRSVLDFTPVSQQDPNYAAFVADFFDPSSVTQAMKILGEQFLTYFSISAKNVSPSDFDTYILQQPVQVGVPIPQNVNEWNQPIVKWDGSTKTAHAVVVMKKNADGTKSFVDSYVPYSKVFSANYPMNIVTVPTITIRDLAQEQISYPVVEWLFGLLKKLGLMYN